MVMAGPGRRALATAFVMLSLAGGTTAQTRPRGVPPPARLVVSERLGVRDAAGQSNRKGTELLEELFVGATVRFSLGEALSWAEGVFVGDVVRVGLGSLLPQFEGIRILDLASLFLGMLIARTDSVVVTDAVSLQASQQPPPSEPPPTNPPPTKPPTTNAPPSESPPTPKEPPPTSQ